MCSYLYFVKKKTVKKQNQIQLQHNMQRIYESFCCSQQTFVLVYFIILGRSSSFSLRNVIIKFSSCSNIAVRVMENSLFLHGHL